MKKLRMFDINVTKIILRFYTMIGLVLIFTFLHQFVLAAFFGNILAVSFILGVSYRKQPPAGVKDVYKMHPASEGVDRRAA